MHSASPLRSEQPGTRAVASYQATPSILREATDVVLPDELRRRLTDWVSARGDEK